MSASPPLITVSHVASVCVVERTCVEFWNIPSGYTEDEGKVAPVSKHHYVKSYY
jgi:hypothetical protein